MALSLSGKSVIGSSNTLPPRGNVRSSEAGLKYFVLGALSSGMLLYGCSLIYGFTGNVNFETIAKVLQGKARDVHPLLYLVAGIFAWYFVHGLLA